MLLIAKTAAKRKTFPSTGVRFQASKTTAGGVMVGNVIASIQTGKKRSATLSSEAWGETGQLIRAGGGVAVGDVDAILERVTSAWWDGFDVLLNLCDPCMKRHTVRLSSTYVCTVLFAKRYVRSPASVAKMYYFNFFFFFFNSVSIQLRYGFGRVQLVRRPYWKTSRTCNRKCVKRRFVRTELKIPKKQSRGSRVVRTAKRWASRTDGLERVSLVGLGFLHLPEATIAGVTAAGGLCYTVFTFSEYRTLCTVRTILDELCLSE